jgi:5-(carboxyamino)imidazole ribonucleotide mutase
VLRDFAIAHESLVVSAHRTPDRMFEFAANAKERGIQIIIAGAGGAAHLPGMLAASTTLPVFGVPVAREASMLRGIDALLSIVQMPRGIPVPTFSIGVAGAANAALSAVSVLALYDPFLAEKLEQFRQRQRDEATTGELA